MPVPLQFSRYVGSPDCPVHSYPTDLQRLLPGRVLPPSQLGSQPARAASDSERVTAFPTRYPPIVSTDSPGTGSDRIWVRSFANTGLVCAAKAERSPGRRCQTLLNRCDLCWTAQIKAT